MQYDSPGRADALTGELLGHWNDEIRQRYDGHKPWLRATRFFSIDVGDFVDPVVVSSISWTGDPAEPGHCEGIDATMVRALTDWGADGRHTLQNEYCEYAVVHRPDRDGHPRPKRVQITTELREYWMCLAIHDPDGLQEIASDVLRREVGFAELYDADPHRLSPEERKTRFATHVAGTGGYRELRHLPTQPQGALNRQNALFMTHPINGLDDLIYIVLFGARPYAVAEGDGFREATDDEIFTARSVKFLACRHADPRAARGAYDAVREKREVGFANPLGVYLRPFPREFLSYEGNPVPEGWIREGRGEDGMMQRLEIGPDDADDAFLDDILFSDDRSEEPLVGGHQIVAKLDVGPLILAGKTEPATEAEYEIVAEAQPIDCANARRCTEVFALKQRFAAAEPPEA